MKILHIEDSGADAELAEGLLRCDWPDCEIVVVSTEADLRAALGRQGWDVILSDFSLVGFNGFDALEIARREVPEVPFLFLSGNIGEDRAIEALRCGAKDYILKDRMKRLPAAIRAALRDTEERRRYRTVEAERARLAEIVESTPDFVGMAAPDGRVLFLNRAARRMIALPEGPLPEGLKIADYRPPEIAARSVRENFAAALRDGMWSGESVLLARNGRTVPVSQVILAHRDERGEVSFLSTVMRDLTATRRNEAFVNGQNQILEMIAAGDPIGDTLDALLRFIESQSEGILCSILCLSEDGAKLRHCAAPSLPDAYNRAVDGLTVGPAAGSCGTAAHRREAVIVDDIQQNSLWAGFRELALAHGLRACWSTPIFDTRHRLLGTMAIYRRETGRPQPEHFRLIDIATHIAAICLSRHETERRLRDQAAVLDKASDAIVAVDMADRVTYWNQSAERTVGWTSAEAIGRRLLELFPPEAAAEIEVSRKAAEQREEWRGELHLRDRAGRPIILDSRVTVLRDDAGRPVGRLSISTDVTAKKAIEEQFFRAQRLESIGMLAAGIAHDLNNILAPIILAAPLLRDRATDPTDRHMLGTLEKSAERGAALVRQILGFARGSDTSQRTVQAKHLLQDLQAFIQETFPKSIELDDSIPSDLWPVKANPAQLHQILLNLCVNARDAMPHGGKLTLRARNVTLDDTEVAQIPGARRGAFLLLHIEDTGTGIPPEILARIWEPFFTTKTNGRGTGLGLSTVRGIVEAHSGFVTVDTEVGRGTVFRVYLPAEEVPASHAPGASGFSAPRGQGELILIVDDEPNIRNVCAAMLTRHGYRVLAAGDGHEAIAIFAPRVHEVRLVVTDLSMPVLDGAALAAAIRRLDPEVKVVAVTGHAIETTGGADLDGVFDAYLVKPFHPDVLFTTVHRLLQRSPGPVAA